MECAEYIENQLSAHADGELTADEEREISEHLEGCVNCRAALEEERELKRLLKARAQAIRAPEHIRAKLVASLDAAGRSASRRRAPAASVWLPIAIAACALIYIFVGRRELTFSSPDFDRAIASLEEYQKNFAPNVPGANTTSLVNDYRTRIDFPVFVWNFDKMGLQLVGGRVDHLADGRTVTYTMYQGDGQSLLCERYKGTDLKPPPGGAELNGIHRIYSYKGYTVCLTEVGGATCLLVTRMRTPQFLKAMAAMEGEG